MPWMERSMKLRSYFVTASALLFLGGCLADGGLGSSAADRARKEDRKKSQAEEAETLVISYKDSPTYLPSEVALVNVSEAPEDGDAVGIEEPTETKRDCGENEMSVHGICYSKEHLAKLQDEQDEIIKFKYQSARGAGEKAQAAHALLEQQIEQLERTEDDLQEIIQIIEDKKSEGSL
jgi:hypothetical protein